MTLSADDEITLVEVAVVLIGIVITWAVYRRSTVGDEPSVSDAAPVQARKPRSADEVGRAAR